MHLVISNQEVKELAKEHGCTQRTIRKAVKNLSYSFCWEERLEDKIDEVLAWEEYQKQNEV